MLATRPRIRRGRRRLEPQRPAATIDLLDAIALQDAALTAGNRSPSTRRTYARALGLFVQFLRERYSRSATWRPPLETLNVENARAWLTWLRASGRYGPASIHVYANVLKILARLLESEDILEDSPLRKFRLPKSPVAVIRTFSDEQLQAMLRAAAAGPHPERDVAIFYVLLDTGVRASELCGLRTMDVDLNAGTAKVFGKGAKERFVQFGETTAGHIARYHAARTHDAPWLFLAQEGGPLTPSALGKATKRWGHAAGIRGPRCSPHDYRHTFACRFLAAHPGALFHLQLLLGHTTLGMTQIYAKVVQGNERLPGLSIADGIGLDKLLPGSPQPTTPTPEPVVVARPKQRRIRHGRRRPPRRESALPMLGDVGRP